MPDPAPSLFVRAERKVASKRPPRYVEEHNTQMPHHAFVGQTPDEVYFNQADRVRDGLMAARRHARRARMAANRDESCRVCRPPPTPQSVSVIHAVANAPP